MATKQQIQTLISTNLDDNSTITAVKHREVENALLDFAEAQWLAGDIKEIDCTTQYIIDNFDGTGLGINERSGWAICNGNNGTKDRTGKVPVGYGSGFTSIGVSGLGYSQSQLVAHTHTYRDRYLAENANVVTDSRFDWKEDMSTTLGSHNKISTNYKGIGQNDDDNSKFLYTVGTTDSAPLSPNSASDTNYPPYIITLFIQKL